MAPKWNPNDVVTLQELLVTTLATSDVVGKLLKSNETLRSSHSSRERRQHDNILKYIVFVSFFGFWKNCMRTLILSTFFVVVLLPAGNDELGQAASNLNRASGPWRLVQRWSASGSRTTESFLIKSSEWRISWDLTLTEKPNPFIDGLMISVYRLSDKQQIATVIHDRPGDGMSYIHNGPGNYYIEVTAFTGSWTLIVEDKR